MRAPAAGTAGKIIAAGGSPVRGEYLERHAFARGDCPGFPQKMAIECRHVDTAPDQVLLDRCIHFRLRFRVAAIPENHYRLGLDGEASDGFVFVTAKHEQRAAESGKRVIECSQGLVQPPLLRAPHGTPVLRGRVVDVDANNRMAGTDRMRECGIVADSLIIPKPNDDGAGFIRQFGAGHVRSLRRCVGNLNGIGDKAGLRGSRLYPARASFMSSAPIGAGEWFATPSQWLAIASAAGKMNAQPVAMTTSAAAGSLK